ncbi:MAG: hypothetical protein K0U93_29905 [Gammaproteobacteria bacterium]|nr:hypothetical protein [Gammaproteobacteria bacterium]
MKRYFNVFGPVLLGLAMTGCAGVGPGAKMPAGIGAQALHQRACENLSISGDPWHVRNLYDCDARSLYVPYQLWTGEKWDGDKGAPCMHTANTRFMVNDVSDTTITGPITWTNPVSGIEEAYWSRRKANGSKTQYFTCHDKGIGRVFDSRGARHYATGRCKFPGGAGWTVGQVRRCRDTSVEIASITLDSQDIVTGVMFNWWTGDRFDHTYYYVPNQGMRYAWAQP